MAAHRYWRIVGLVPHDLGSLVEISEFWLLSGQTRVDGPATMTSSAAPVSGALADLRDADTSTLVLLSKATVLSWDFGTATDVTNIRIGAGDSRVRFPVACQLLWSDDGVEWRELNLFRTWAGIRWPGRRALTENVQRFVPIEHKLIRTGFEGANPLVPDYGTLVSFTTSTGAAVVTSGAIQGARSYQFSGTGALWASASTLFSHTAGIDFTIQAKVRATASTDGTRVITAFGNMGAGTGLAYLALNPNTKVLSGVVVGNGATRSIVSPAGAVEWLNVTHHVAFSSENGTMRLFIDGVLVATSVGAHTITAESNVAIAIGNYILAGSNTFLGLVDEVGIDHKALYVANFTPPASIVPQAEWLIDASIALPAVRGAFSVPAVQPPVFGSNRTVLRKPIPIKRDFRFDFKARGRIVGTVKEKNTPSNLPLARRVRLYRDRDGMLIAETWSNAAGNYVFENIEEGETYTTIAYDHTHNYRAVAADNLTLANGGLELMP